MRILPSLSCAASPGSTPRRRALRGNAAWLASLLALQAALGCSSERPTYPVTGTVSYSDGSLVTAGTVAFESDEDLKTRVNARGEIQPDGTFRLSRGQADGAVEGRHRAIVVPPEDDSEEKRGKTSSPVIGQRFWMYETSGLEFNVETKGTNHFQIVVERR